MFNYLSFLALFRNHIGILWENYLLSERIKKNNYSGKEMQYYFWRTYDQQEIDLAEVGNGLLHAYEFKWSAGAKAKLPEFFRKSYPESTFKIISKENYLEWIL